MLFLLDAGHGGIINGTYQTPGKRSPTWEDGSVLYEGEFNRAIVARIKEQLNFLKLRYVDITCTDEDLSLRARVQVANYYHYQEADCVYVSIHSNAGGGHGFEVFTSPGQTRSDIYAAIFAAAFMEEFPGERVRADFTDGDVDKEAGFYILRRTKMPSVLTENFFMDNEFECKTYLMTKEGRDRIATYHVVAMQRIAQMQEQLNMQTI